MKLAILLVALTGCVLGSAAEPTASTDFVTEPTDVVAVKGENVEMDCELTASDIEAICVWKVVGTNLNVTQFYNVYPPPKVQSLFPDGHRVCSIVINNIDSNYAGSWTCFPLAGDAHISSRSASVSVIAPTGPRPTVTTPWSPTEPATTPSAPPTPEPTTPEPTTPEPTTPEPTTIQPTTPAATSTTPAPPATTTTAPPTVGPTPSPGPGFQCPQPNGLFADPASSHYFYYCQDNIPVHMQCEAPTTWDDTQKNCA